MAEIIREDPPSGVVSRYEASTHIPLATYEQKKKKYGKADKVLGKGTYGVVKKHKKYAIKKMLSEDVSNGVQATTIREISCLIRLNHPNVINVVDVYANIPKTILYVVMPLALYDLDTYIKGSPPPEIRTKKIAYQIIAGVGYCLSKHVINRDIKPPNILVFDGDIIKIADFGLARSTICASESGLTNEVYTFWYRPPEILLGGRYIESADIWSTGCVLYELYTGRVLFPGNNSIGSRDMIVRFSSAWGPLTNQWDSIKDLPDWKQSYATLQKSTDPFTSLNSDVRDIITSMVQINPAKRANLHDIITRPYFDNVRDQTLDSLTTPCSCLSMLLTRDEKLDYSSLETKDINDLIIVEMWIIEVSLMFKLLKDSLILCFYLLEKYYILVHPAKEDLQLIGSACLSLACKYCEVYAPELNDYVYMSANAFTLETIRETELKVLEVLGYDLFISTSMNFFNVYSDIGRYDQKTINFGKRILPVVHLGGRGIQRDEAIAALFMACTHMGTTFKHTSYLSSDIMTLVEKTQKFITNKTLHKQLSKILGIKPEDLKTQQSLVL